MIGVIPDQQVDVSSFNTLWIWGVLVCTFGTAMTSFGLVLQKYSHHLNDRCEEPIAYYRQPWWMVGFAVFLFAQIVNLLSMSMAPQVMLSCLGALALIFNAIAAWIILGERIRGIEMVAMLGVVIGVVMVICTTPASSTWQVSEKDPLHSVVGPVLSSTFLTVAAALALLVIMARVICVNCFPSQESIFWVLCSAISSGYTVTLFKCISMFVTAWNLTQCYRHWQCYLILIVAMILCVSQIHCLNLALKIGRALTVVPNYFALSLLAQLGVGEAAAIDVPFTTAGTIVFIGGIVLILFLISAVARMRIAYEKQPGDVSEEVLRKASDGAVSPVADKKLVETQPQMPTSEAERVPLIHHRSMSWQGTGMERFWSMEDDGDLQYVRANSLDPDMFSSSFEGKERRYTISVMGPLGLA